MLANGEAPFEAETILDYMGVEMKNAIVQNSAPSWWNAASGNVKEHIMRLFPTYIRAGSPEESRKPEKALQRGAIPTDAEFVQKVDLLISGYLNYEPYYGSVPADKRKTPHRCVQRASGACTACRAGCAESDDAAHIEAKKVDREGVYLNIRGKKSGTTVRSCTACGRKKKVYLRYDPDDLSSVRVYREDGSFILTAPGAI